MTRTNQPTGPLTFLFTDIEGSTRLWEFAPDEMQIALARHDIILRQHIENAGGYIFKTIGDAFCAAFQEVNTALSAAIDIQQALVSEEWSSRLGSLRVRMGLYSGTAQARDGDYFGQAVNRVARLMNAAHGGQILVAHSAFESADQQHFQFKDLGQHRLKDLMLAEHIFQLNAADLPNDFPPLRTLPERRHNLPIQLTSFIGREREIAAVRELLENPQIRLLMLTGPGGTGKTRLSLQLAAEVVEQFEDGVWFVELAALNEPALTTTALAAALNLPEEANQPLLTIVTNFLQDKSCLLILDNCEHLIETAAELAEQLLRKCPKLKLLASSREAFNIAGETVWRVPSLSMPGPEVPIPFEDLSRYEAIRLFVDRARLVKTEFAPTPENATALIQICRRLDGIPLALEMAAARLRAMSLEQIASRLDHIFKLLTSGSRTALPRQQTLRALIDWSYDLLDDSEKSLLGQLSVFFGSWSLEATESLASFETLLQLVNKSLVFLDETGEETRYRMLETIRQYGQEKLGEVGQLEKAQHTHACYFLNFAAENSIQLRRRDQYAWFNRFELEHDNFRAALNWAIERKELELAATLCNNLVVFWVSRGYIGDGWLWYKQIYTLVEPSPSQLVKATYAQLLQSFGWLCQLKGETKNVQNLYQQAIQLFSEIGNKSGQGHSLLLLQNHSLQNGSIDEAHEIGVRALQLFQAADDKWGYAHALLNMGWAIQAKENLEVAFTYLKEALAIFRELGDWGNVAHTLQNYAWSKRSHGAVDEAIAAYEEAIELRRQEKNWQAVAGLLNGIGTVMEVQGDYDKAEFYYEESIQYRRQINNMLGLGAPLNNLATLALYRKDYAKSIALYNEALALTRKFDNRFNYSLVQANLAMALLVSGQVEAALHEAEEALPPRRANGNKIGLIHGLGVLAWTYLKQNKPDLAEAAFREALGYSQDTGDQIITPFNLEGLAAITILKKDYAFAIRLLAATEAWYNATKTKRAPDIEHLLAPYREILVEQVAPERYQMLWQEGSNLDFKQTLIYALEPKEVLNGPVAER